MLLAPCQEKKTPHRIEGRISQAGVLSLYCANDLVTLLETLLKKKELNIFTKDSHD